MCAKAMEQIKICCNDERLRGDGRDDSPFAAWRSGRNAAKRYVILISKGNVHDPQKLSKVHDGIAKEAASRFTEKAGGLPPFPM